MTLSKQKTCSNTIAFAFLCLLAAIFLIPILLVLLNSFKSRFYISSSPFAMPNSETFVGFENYLNGLSVFMFTGFVKAVPLEIEEAAEIDGCNPLQTFFLVVFPILKPTIITVSILNSMWVWNDYLLPYLILGTDHKTVPVAIQIAMQGAYGATDYGGFMAMLVLAIIPIVIFYIASQKYIIKGVISGAVKG